MPDVTLERSFPVPPERLFAFVSETANLLEWWGPESITVAEHALDFTRPGPWHSVMVNDEGQRFKVSGQVTHVDPPRSVGFTWGWHDDDDRRGAESHVTLTVSDDGDGGSRLTLDHRDLADDETATRHTAGWTSSLRKLERLAQ